MVMKLFHHERLSIRGWRKQDALELAEAANNADVASWVRDIFPHPYSLEDAYAFLGRALLQIPPMNFALVWDGRIAGGAGLQRKTDVERLTVEIGYWVNPAFANLGIATHTVEFLRRYAMEELKAARVEALVFDRNFASMRVLEKNGFLHEGTLRKSVSKNDRLMDSHVYAFVGG